MINFSYSWVPCSTPACKTFNSHVLLNQVPDKPWFIHLGWVAPVTLIKPSPSHLVEQEAKQRSQAMKCSNSSSSSVLTSTSAEPKVSKAVVAWHGRWHGSLTRLCSVRDAKFQNMSEISRVGTIWIYDVLTRLGVIRFYHIFEHTSDPFFGVAKNMEQMVILTSVARIHNQAVLICDRFWCERSIAKPHWSTVDDCWSSDGGHLDPNNAEPRWRIFRNFLTLQLCVHCQDRPSKTGDKSVLDCFARKMTRDPSSASVEIPFSWVSKLDYMICIVVWRNLEAAL